MARRPDPAPAPTTSSDATGHRHELLDPDIDPKPAAHARPSGFMRSNRHVIGIVGAIVVAAVVIAMIAKGHWGSAPTATVTAPQGAVWQETVPQGPTCPDVSANETRRCLVGEHWTNWVKMAEKHEDNAIQPCVYPPGPFERMEKNGTTFWRFRWDKGQVEKQYRLYPISQACPAPLPPPG